MDVGLILNEEVLKGWVADIDGISPVSYTHLTLPTILLV